MGFASVGSVEGPRAWLILSACDAMMHRNTHLSKQITSALASNDHLEGVALCARVSTKADAFLFGLSSAMELIQTLLSRDDVPKLCFILAPSYVEQADINTMCLSNAANSGFWGFARVLFRLGNSF